MAKIKIIQTGSVIDRPKNQKATIVALGLGRPNYEKIHNDTPQIRQLLDSFPDDKQYSFVYSFRMEPFVKPYFEED